MTSKSCPFLGGGSQPRYELDKHEDQGHCYDPYQ